MRRFSIRHILAFAATSALVPRPVFGQAPPSPEPSQPSEPAPEAPPTAPPPAPSPEEEAGARAAEAEDEAVAEAETEAEPAQEELVDDEAEAELDPARPPAKGKGVVWGVLSDSKANEPLLEASIQVIGTKIEVLTDYEGRFRLELPPGVYAIRAYYELHEPARFENVEVRLGRVVRFDAKLEPVEDAIDTIEVETRITRSTVEGEILTRRRSAAVGDSLGRHEISKSPDRNTAQAAQRVVGANVVGGRFVYVRGLGERYTNALLDGVPLPSPEPDRAAVPLDLFPTAVVNSLTIAKTFTPDVPADFAGGSVRIETREIPERFLLQTSLSGGYNSQASLRKRLTHRGGDLDWLGFDDGTRALPSGFPRYKLSNNSSKPDGSAVSAEDRGAAGRLLNSYMSSRRSMTPFDHGGSVVLGNGWDLKDGRKLGFLGSVNYNRSYSLRSDELRRVFQEGTSEQPDGIIARDYRIETGNENVTWGAFGSLSYRLGENHELTLLGIHTTAADNATYEVEGFHQGRNAVINDTRLSFISRSLETGKLSGKHVFPELGHATLDWNVGLSHASRDQPDTRDAVWQLADGTSVWRTVNSSESGRHFFAEQTEDQVGGGLDWTQPLTRTEKAETDSKLKLGGLVSLRSRDFSARTFRFEPRGLPPVFSCPGGDLNACTDAVYVPSNIGPDGVLDLQEVTLEQDAYEATLDVYAGYLMADLALSESFRVILGERVEHTFQSVDPYDQFGVVNSLSGAQISQTDLLPSASFVWSTSERTKLRASLARTLARPQLRELAPFIYQDFFGGRPQTGNPELELTTILNADARYEFYPTLREVLAASFFYKRFTDPIEPVVKLSSDDGQVTYRNAEGADLYGVELEARKGLDFVSENLRKFSVVTNLTLATSSIEVGDEETLALTNHRRPLVNQAPYVFNFSLDYENEDTGTNARLLYNVVGPTLVEVGTKNARDTPGLDDAYLHPRQLLDLTLQQAVTQGLELKLSIKNLLNSPYKVSQGCGRESNGQGGSRPRQGLFDTTFRLTCDAPDSTITRRYTDGVSVSVSGSYTF